MDDGIDRITVFAGGQAVIEGAIVPTDIAVAGGRIVDLDIGAGAGLTPAGATVVDCRGAVIAPGFVDLQCNGAAGLDVTTQPGSMRDVGRALTRFGVTSYLPTVVTAPEQARTRALDAMAGYRLEGWRPGDGAVALGLHFEGPAISPAHVGAHTPELVTLPGDDEIDRWLTSGTVALVTLAPETPGALAMTRRLAAGGVVVSCGHTAMTPDHLAEAAAAGATYVTHLFNAMAPFSHRAPGPIGAVLADDRVVAGLIVDGLHVDPIAVRMAWRALGAARVSLVSDAAPPLGMPYGTYTLGRLEVQFDEQGVRTRDGVLAGSALALDQAVRNLVAYTGCSLAEAIATVTSTPADLLGLTDRGRIRTGAHADLTVLTPDGRLLATVVAGSIEWDAR